MNRRPRILVVDDDTSLLEAIESILSFQYEVVTARRGGEGIHALSQQEVDLVLLDFLLKDCSGLALLSYIKHKYRTIPVVFMTAYGSERVAQLAQRAGGRDYLPKPFKPEELLASVQRVLKAREEGPTGVPVFMPGGPASLLDGGPGDIPLWRALGHIERHYGSPITREDVAREAGMSPAHFSRKFKKFVGKTFQAYLTRLRLGRAKELLRDPELSISEVARRVGFTSEAHFSRVFRKVTGQTPTAYRREVLEASRPARPLPTSARSLKRRPEYPLPYVLPPKASDAPLANES